MFNLDNKRLIYYDFFFQYLHLMVEGKNPLAAFYRSVVRAHAVLDITEPPSLKLVQSAWNSFGLLNINYTESFKCPICGIYPQLVVCDGTLIGFRKDLFPPLLAKKPNMDTLVQTYGSKHNDHTFIRSPKGRELLLKYSGYTKDRKKTATDKTISKTEW